MLGLNTYVTLMQVIETLEDLDDIASDKLFIEFPKCLEGLP